jgi:hypothetical protein
MNSLLVTNGSKKLGTFPRYRSNRPYKQLAATVLAFAVLLPVTRAVDPPPGGGYPGGNTALGDNALFSQPNGLAADSTAIGFQALYHNILGGNENTAVGSNCLYNNTTGGANTGIGFWTLYSNTTGDGNTAVGDFVLEVVSKVTEEERGIYF